MADTDATAPETVTQPDLKNDGGAPTAPATDNGGDKEADKLRMELSMLRNKLTKAEQEQSARDKAELEEKENFRELYERNQKQLEDYQAKEDAAQRSATLSLATDSVLKDFSVEVAEIAKTAGLGVADDTDEAKAELKAKLEAISKKVAPSQTTRVAGNNGAINAPQSPDRAQLVKGMRFGDPASTREAINGLSAIKAMKQQAGVSE